MDHIRFGLALALAVWILPIACSAQLLNWHPTGGPTGGNVLEFHVGIANTVFAGTAAGIYRTEDAGKHWTRAVTDQTPRRTIGFFRTPSGTLYARTDENAPYELLRSVDTGRTWQRVSEALNKLNIVGAGTTPNGDIVAATGSALFVSKDDGQSWHQFASPPQQPVHHEFSAFGITRSGALLSVAYAYEAWIRRSTDSGRTWIHTNISNTGIMSWIPVDSTVTFAITKSNIPVVLRSSDDGASWATMPDSLGILSMAVQPNGNLVAGCRKGFMQSTDRGVTWSPLPTDIPEARVTAVIIDSAGIIFADADKRLVVSDDNGATFSNRSTTTADVRAILVDNADNYLAATYGNGVQASTDRGASWSVREMGLPSRNVSALLQLPNGRLVSGTDRGTAVSDDTGRTWHTIRLGRKDVRALLLGRSGDVFAAAWHGRIYRSHDGDGWDTLSNGLTGDRLNCLACDSSGTIFAGTDVLGVYRSDDNGDSWYQANAGLPSFPSITAMTVSPIDGMMYAGVSQGAICRSADGGTSWMLVDSLGMGVIQAMTVDAANNLYICPIPGPGVMRLRNGASVWDTLATGLGNPNVAHLMFDHHGALLAGTRGTGIFQTEDSVYTWPRSTTQSELPTAWIDAPAPNPAASGTIIRYRLTSPAHLRITIFDALGRLVGIPYDDDCMRGGGSATIDVRGLAAGVYSFRVSIGSLSKTLRCVVMH